MNKHSDLFLYALKSGREAKGKSIKSKTQNRKVWGKDDEKFSYLISIGNSQTLSFYLVGFLFDPSDWKFFGNRIMEDG